MKPVLVITAIATAGLIAGARGVAGRSDVAVRPGIAQDAVASSRAAVQELAQAIQAELQNALKAGGPVNAISACRERAPAVTAAIARQKGLTMGRTSLKPRNPANSPDAWERKVLEDFERRRAGGEATASLEFSEVVKTSSQSELRYMKAIVIAEGAPCLTCHGSNIAPTLAAKLKTLYPDDQATGYKTGDIRGAFSVRQAR